MANQRKKRVVRKGETPLMRQYGEIKAQYPDSLVLFRMGDFYETFEEDAKIASKILGIALTKRANGAAADIPLAGFPYHALESYLYKLIRSGLRVAICEQVEDPKLAKGLVKREVVEVVTPGTAISDNFLDHKSNNFLSAIFQSKFQIGFAFLDHSTGEFYVGESPKENLREILIKFAPKEMIVVEGLEFEKTDWYKKLRPFITEMDEWAFDYDTSLQSLLEHFGTTTLKGFGCDGMMEGISAAGVILRYVQHNIHGSLDHVTKLTSIKDDEVMGLDEFTIRNLEIFKSLMTQGTHGTLIDILDKTITSGGGRLLRYRLKRPLTNRSQIENRINCVEGFVNDNDLRLTVIRRLSGCTDLERIVAKLSQGKATPRDVWSLKQTLELIPTFMELLENSESHPLKELAHRFKDTSGLVGFIEQIITDSPPISLANGGVICDGVDNELDELRVIASGGKNWIASLKKSEREKTGISSLKIGYNKVFGYYLEVTKTHLDKVPDTYIRKQTLVNAERYVTPELKEYEEKILNAEEKIIEIETRIFQELRESVLKEAEKIQDNAKIINQIDLYSTLAEVAKTHNYCKPSFVEKPSISLIESRHPVVETILSAGESFIPNDLRMSGEDDQILLITGPNMAGKSTYLRQVGLIIVMAQMGSYVPASEAKVGIVDRLFTRVGASDNLAGGESTFLVEMIEAANILNNATQRSLVLFDEIGRGTATYDGLSLAWAITEYLHYTPSAQARTLFATHYHELTELENLFERVKNYNVAVKEFGDRIVFLRKIVPGPCDKSYGIHVAKMAGLPKSVISRATEILSRLVHHDLPEKAGTDSVQSSSKQLSIFEEKETQLRHELSELDINKITPLEALKKLDELKSEFGL